MRYDLVLCPRLFSSLIDATDLVLPLSFQLPEGIEAEHSVKPGLGIALKAMTRTCGVFAFG